MKRRYSLQPSVVGIVLLGWAFVGLAETKVQTEPVRVSAEELLQMQTVEPTYVPQDQRAVQLFMLQKIVADNEQNIKDKTAQTIKMRTIFYQKFKSDLTRFSEEKVGNLDQRYNKSLEDLIRNFEAALKNNPEAAFAPDAMYLLGQYYFEIDEKDYFAKLALYSKAKEEKREDVAYPEENFTRTIDMYEKLSKKYPKFHHISDVYYLLAMALWYEGAFASSIRYFQDLIGRFPNSRYVEEVWFRLGEYFFDMEEYPQAIQAYEYVVRNPKSLLYDKALYKLAWTYYQQNDFQKAIELFLQVLDLTPDEKGEGSAALMRQEVTKYIVKSFAELIHYGSELPRRIKTTKTTTKTTQNQEKEHAELMGKMLAEYIINYFETHGKPKYLKEIYLETASQLLDESKIDGAVIALQAVINLDPESRDNPRIDNQIVDIYQDAHRLEDARQASVELIKRYNKQSDWYLSKANDLKAQMIARDAVRDAMLGLAVYYHRTGKKLKEEKDEAGAIENFDKAAEYYLAYVQEYPERDDTHKAIFYFAESSYELNRFQTALEAYQLLKEYPLPMPDNFRRDATYNIVFTFKHVLEKEAELGRFKTIDFDALTSKQRGTEKEEIPLIGLQYLSAIDDFLALAPQDPQVPVLLFHAAAIYYVYGHIDEAVARFFHIIDTYPESQAALVAARLLVDDALAQGNWKRVSELSKRFREQNIGSKAQDFARLEGDAKFKMALAVFQEANELHKNHQISLAKEKYKESASMFETLLKEDPKSPYADIMLFNSARAIVQSGSTLQALPYYKRLYSEYPKSQYAKIARFQEALALEKMLKFREAAEAYNGIINQDPHSEEAQNAMLNKALLYEAAGDNAQAIAAFTAFARKYPDRAEAPDALLKAAALYKEDKNIKEQIATLEQFIKQYRKDPSKAAAVIEAHVEVADTYGEMAEASKTPALVKSYHKAQVDNYRAALALFSQDLPPIASYYAAKAQLFLEKPELDAFNKMRISGRTGKVQSEQLTAMTKKLAELSAKNEGIIRTFAQPVWNAESLLRIGSLYDHLAKAMLGAPCPSDVAAIDEYACDEYIVLLEDKAAVLEEKALDAYVQAYDIATKAYDAPASLIDRIQAALNRLRPGKYQRVGNVIEKPVPGAFYGQGRMLSTGRMASSLHEKEIDPDIKPKVIEQPEPEQKNAAPVEESPPALEANPSDVNKL